MTLLLGSFTNGAFQGAQAMQGILSNIQSYQDKAAMIQAANDAKSAMQSGASSTSGPGFVPMDQTVQTDQSTPASATSATSNDPLAGFDPTKSIIDPTKGKAPKSETQDQASGANNGLFDASGNIRKGALDADATPAAAPAAAPAAPSATATAVKDVGKGLQQAAKGLQEANLTPDGYQDASIADPGPPPATAAATPPAMAGAPAAGGMAGSPMPGGMAGGPAASPASPAGAPTTGSALAALGGKIAGAYQAAGQGGAIDPSMTGAQAPAPGTPALASAAAPVVGGRPMPGQPAPTMAGGAPAGGPTQAAGGPTQTAGGPTAAPGGPTPAPGGPTQAAGGPTPAGNGQTQQTGSATGTGNQPVGSSVNDTSDPAAQGGVGSTLLGMMGISPAQADEAPKPGSPAASATAAAGPNGSGGTPRLPPAKTDDDATAAPIAPNTPAVVTNAPSAKVTPDQAGPTAQTEPTPTYITPPFMVKPWLQLQDQQPAVAAEVAKIAAENGVTPYRLAAHWQVESGMRPTAPIGAAGEHGIMQIMPGTRDEVDPNHTLDPDSARGSLTLAARIIKKLDDQFGQDTVASVASYNGGPGVGASLQAGRGAGPQIQDYLNKIQAKYYPGQNLGPQNIVPTAQPDPAQLQAAMKAGPDSFIRYLASTAPAGTSMGGAWKQAEISAVYAHMRVGDTAGAQAAQDQIESMSRQGANQALMNADRALAAGDGAGAAAQLARAHAFFPDGSMGRFGVDKSGTVWATRVSENDPSLELGKPFQVTRQGLQTQLIQTSDPDKYRALVAQQQQQAAQAEFMQRHGDALMASISEKKDAATMALQGRLAAAELRANAAEQVAGTHLAGQELTAHPGTIANPGQGTGALGANPKQDAQIDKEMTGFVTDGTLGPQPTAQNKGQFANMYSFLRKAQGGPGGEPMASYTAADVAGGAVTGRYKIAGQADGSARIYDPSTPNGGHTLAYLPPQMAASLGLSHGAAPVQKSALGSPAPYNPYGSSAVPAQNAPTSTASN